MQTIYAPAAYQRPDYRDIDKQLARICSGYTRLATTSTPSLVNQTHSSGYRLYIKRFSRQQVYALHQTIDSRGRVAPGIGNHRSSHLYSAPNSVVGIRLKLRNL